MLLIEWGLVIIAVIWGFTFPGIGANGFASFEQAFARIARRKSLSVVAVGLGAMALRVVLLPILPIPEAGVHDEFSYLLMSDTFAHGRFTNPTHPMWVHFETFHVIQKPTYASMYFPAQGLFLAAGQVMFHHPFWGVWITAGLMCGAICWMLQGWLAPIWALLGGMLAVIRLATFSYWANTYFGGNVAALGGALVLGAFPRIKRNQRTRDAVLMGIGLALLANSRPYEGLFFSLPIGLLLVLWFWRKHRDNFKEGFFRLVFPLALVLSITAALMLYYFWRVTGNPFRTPFSVNLATYDPVPYFPWESVKRWPIYRHEIMRHFYTGWLLDYYEFGRSHPMMAVLIKLASFWCFYLGPLFTMPLLMLAIVLPRGFSLRDINSQTRILLVVAAVTLIGVMLPVFTNPHYAAPITAAVYALLLAVLQRIRHWRCHGKPTGLAIVRSVPTLAVTLLVIISLGSILKIQRRSMPQTWCSPYQQRWERPVIQARLEQLLGRQLVLVRYSPDHDPRSSWVANVADIEGSKIVWANDMGPKQNHELMNYFKDRKVWLVEPDATPAKFSEYESQPGQTTATPSKGPS